MMTRIPVRRRVIPGTAWAIAVVVAIIIGLIAIAAVVGREAEPVAAILIAPFVSIVLGAYILLIGYVYGDAKRRGMRYVLWTWLAILIPNAIGIILYFILRDPLQVYCSKCGYPNNPKHAFCSSCGASVAPACPQCKRVVQTDWAHCPSCGVALARA